MILKMAVSQMCVWTVNFKILKAWVEILFQKTDVYGRKRKFVWAHIWSMNEFINHVESGCIF